MGSGGMGSGSGLSLGERAAMSGVGRTAVPHGSPDPAAPAGLVLQDRGSGARHCWVAGLPGVADKCPGLLSMWARDGAGAGAWFGRVVYAVAGAGGDVVLVEAWVPAEHLHPATF